MSPFEIGIIVIVCCLPIVALIMILPKHLKKKNSKKTEAKQIETKQESAPKTSKTVETPKQDTEVLSSREVDKDIKSFIDNRKASHPAPTEKSGDLNEFGRYNPNMFRRPIMPSESSKKEDKSIKEQINDLSPELKAIIFSGALERKNFDDDNNT